MTRRSLSVILPAFNEEGSLEAVTRRVDAVFTALEQPGEIIVVDDGSLDKTGLIADRLQDEIPRVRAIHHDRNRGYGAAQRTGIEAAVCEWVCVLPADGQVPPESLEAYVAAADQADVVVGRYRRRDDTWLRRLLSRSFNLTLRALFGLELANVNAPKLYRRAQLRDVVNTADGGFADAQIVLQLHRQGRRFREVDVDCGPRLSGRSSVRTGAALRAVWDLWLFHRSSRRSSRAHHGSNGGSAPPSTR